MPTDAHIRGEAIERWMSAILTDGGILRFDDLHIDQVDPAWRDRNQWIEAGLEAFRISIDVRNRNRLPFGVGLGFSLESGNQARGIDFQTREEPYARLDWSPPSLHLFRRGAEPHTQVAPADGTVQPLDPATLGAQRDVRCYYLEFKQPGSTEFCRSVFVEG
jgi:hypothetical protein